MDQPTFADLEYQGRKRKTRRELFLRRMDGLISDVADQLDLSSASRSGLSQAGRRVDLPIILAVMLRVHCVQLYGYNLRPRHGGPPTRLNRSGGSRD